MSPDDVHDKIIRHIAWIAEHIPSGRLHKPFDHHGAFASRAIEDILADFQSFQAGCQCGGMCEVLRQLARRDGIEMFAMNFGGDGPFTHVIACAKTDAGYRFYCPTFAGYYRTEAGTVAGLPDIVAALASSTAPRVAFRPVWRGIKYKLVRSSRIHSISHILSHRPAADPDYAIIGRDIRTIRLQSARRYLAWLAGKIEHPTTLDILRLPISDSGTPDAIAVTTELEKLRPISIPLG